MNLSRLLRPESIAVIGGREAGEVIRQCRRMGYAGRLHAVNPRGTDLLGVPCVSGIRDLPEAPDAAFVAVPGKTAVEIIGELQERGAGGAVCYASGFSEVGGDGSALQAELLRRAGDMPVMGPNCYGFINYLDGSPLWPDQHGGERCERGVAILSQSGNMGINFTMQRRGLPLAYQFSLGNQAVVGMSDIVRSLLDDERVTAVGLHLEGIDDLVAFDQANRAARDRRIPLVVLKTGKTAVGAQLALSHTASLAGEDRVFDALLRRLGVGRVHSLSTFLETLKLLHCHGPLPGKTLVSMSCSGGEASLIADTAEAFDVDFPAFSRPVADAIRESVHPLVSVSNPFDYHTFDWGDGDRLARTFSAVLAAEVDLALLVLDFPRGDRCEDADWWVAAEALVTARDAAPLDSSGSPPRVGVLSTFADCLPEAVSQSLMSRGIAPLSGIDEVLGAVEAAASIGRALDADAPEPLSAAPAPDADSDLLNESESKQALAEFGLRVPQGQCCSTGAEALVAARALGYPVALKALGGGIAHKSEIGAVKLDLRDDSAVEDAVVALAGMGDSILVERMVDDAVAEFLIGVARDPVVGPYVVIGAGGVLVELLQDSEVLTVPLARGDIEDALARLRCAPILAGYRGGPPGDRDAVVDAIEAVGRYVVANHAAIIELDINPLMVLPRGRGAVAADALIRLSKGD